MIDNPDFAETCRYTYDNYDRSSVYDEETGTYKDIYHRYDDPAYAHLYADYEYVFVQ